MYWFTESCAGVSLPTATHLLSACPLLLVLDQPVQLHTRGPPGTIPAVGGDAEVDNVSCKHGVVSNLVLVRVGEGGEASGGGW